MQKKAGTEEAVHVVGIICGRGLIEHISQGNERVIIGAVGDERMLRSNELGSLSGMERVIRILNGWQTISREVQPEDSVTRVRDVAFGGSRMLDATVDEQSAGRVGAVYAGPFYLPARAYTGWDTGKGRAREADMKDSLQRPHEAGKSVLVRIRDVRQVGAALTAEVDISYLGGELMDNRALRDEVGRLSTPIVLCRGKHHRADDWLIAVEHITQHSNCYMILGEVGTLSFRPEHIRQLDVDAVVRVWRMSHLPVIINITRLWHNDISQNVLYRLAVATGANGVINSLRRIFRRPAASIEGRLQNVWKRQLKTA